MWSKKAIAQLDQWFPYAGECAFCGSKDSRHRVWDMIISRNKAGEAIDELADDYRKPVAGIQAVLTIRPYHRGGRLL